MYLWARDVSIPTIPGPIGNAITQSCSVVWFKFKNHYVSFIQVSRRFYAFLTLDQIIIRKRATLHFIKASYRLDNILGTKSAIGTEVFIFGVLKSYSPTSTIFRGEAPYLRYIFCAKFYFDVFFVTVRLRTFLNCYIRLSRQSYANLPEINRTVVDIYDLKITSVWEVGLVIISFYPFPHYLIKYCKERLRHFPQFNSSIISIITYIYIYIYIHYLVQFKVINYVQYVIYLYSLIILPVIFAIKLFQPHFLIETTRPFNMILHQ